MATKKTSKIPHISKEVLDASKYQYQQASGWNDLERDEDGFVKLHFTAKKTDERVSELTADIDSIEAQLKKYKAERSKHEKFKKTDDYKESKKSQKLSNKKKKKQKATLLEMIFNDMDAEKEREKEQEDNEDDDDLDEDSNATLVDSPKTKRKKRAQENAEKKKRSNKLDTTYGTRFSPIISLIQDTIFEFDEIAAEIQDELRRTKGPANSSSRGTMYRSSQIGNLISTRTAKMQAIKEMTNIAKTVSDYEYKKEKDKKNKDENDDTSLIASFGAKFLRGAMDDDDGKKGKKKKKKDNDSMSSSSSKRRRFEDDDDEEDYYDGGKRSSGRSAEEDKELALELAKALEKNKGAMSFTPAERFAALDGTYEPVVLVTDERDPKNNFKFIAVDTKTGKEIKDFKENYPGLLPKKSEVKLSFASIDRLKCTDKNTARTFKVMIKG